MGQLDLATCSGRDKLYVSTDNRFALRLHWYHRTKSIAPLNASMSQPTGSAEPEPSYASLGKAKSLFVLRNPEPATERSWEAYIANRLEAVSRFRGGTEDEHRDDEDEWDDCDSSVFVLKAIRKIFATLEREMKIEDRILQKSFRLVSCDAQYDDSETVCNCIEP